MMLSDVWRLSDDVCRVHREYSWRPQLLEARRAGRRRPGVRRVWAGAGPQRATYRGGPYRGGRPPTACYFCTAEKRQHVREVEHYCSTRVGCTNNVVGRDVEWASWASVCLSVRLSPETRRAASDVACAELTKSTQTKDAAFHSSVLHAWIIAFTWLCTWCSYWQVYATWSAVYMISGELFPPTHSQRPDISLASVSNR